MLNQIIIQDLLVSAMPLPSMRQGQVRSGETVRCGGSLRAASEAGKSSQTTIWAYALRNCRTFWGIPSTSSASSFRAASSAIAVVVNTPPASVGTQIVVAVIVGLLTAFAVQFLLTNLGLALGFSLLKYQPQASSKQATQSSQSESEGINVNISFFAGLGILFTLNSVLFIACFLAVRFSTASEPISGATLGIVIWSTYFLLLIWVSYSAVDSVAGWVFGTVATKLRQLIMAIASSISGTGESNSQLLTEEAAAKLVQEELQAALGGLDLEQSIDEYIKTMPSPQLDLTAISQGFADSLAKLNLESFARENLLHKIDRQTFVALIDERSNLPTSIVEQVVDRLEEVWQQATGDYQKQDVTESLLEIIQTASPEELQFEQLVKHIERSIDGESSAINGDQDEAVSDKISDFSLGEDLEIDSDQSENMATLGNFIAEKLDSLDPMAIKNALLQRIDLSEVELEDVWHYLHSAYQKVSSSELTDLPFNTIRNDVEDYLWRSPSWYWNCETVRCGCERGWQEFKEIIYDPQADPALVYSQLEQVQLSNLVKLRLQKDDLETARIEEIIGHFEAVKQEVLATLEETELTAESPEPNQQSSQLRQKLESYLRYTNLDLLTPAKIDAKLAQLEQEAEELLPEPGQLLVERAELLQILERRKGIELEQAEAIVAQIETKWQKSPQSSTLESQLKTKARSLSENLVDYLYQAIEQNPDLATVEADLLPLLNLDRQKTQTLVARQLTQLNWQEIEAQLQQAQKHSKTQIRQTIKQVREATRKLIKYPRRWATRTSKQTKDTVAELADFFRYGNKLEFTSERLEQELKSIFNRSETQFDLEEDAGAKNRESQLELAANVTRSLNSRSDLTPFEIEQTRDRALAMIKRLSAEMRTQQGQTNELVQDLVARLGESFSSLNLRHDYESLQDSLADFDLQSWRDSWQEAIAEIPIEELGDRLGELSQQTLAKIMQSNQILYDSTSEQFQGIQDYFAQQIETIKQSVDQRAENFKQQTLQQVETARKAISTAAYWMFAITFTSAIASALAGFLATRSSF